MFLSRQFTRWRILYSFPVNLFLKVEVDFICLQHLYARFDLQGAHFPILFRLRFTTRFFSILFPPRSCCRFGFLLYAINGFLVNFFAISLLIDKMSQFVDRTSFRFGRALLKVVTKVSGAITFSFGRDCSSSFRSFLSARLIASCNCDSL